MTSTMTSTDLDNDRCPRCGERLGRAKCQIDCAAMLALLKDIEADWPATTSVLRERGRTLIAEAEANGQ